jgi:hypothetical protein
MDILVEGEGGSFIFWFIAVSVPSHRHAGLRLPFYSLPSVYSKPTQTRYEVMEKQIKFKSLINCLSRLVILILTFLEMVDDFLCATSGRVRLPIPQKSPPKFRVEK